MRKIINIFIVLIIFQMVFLPTVVKADNVGDIFSQGKSFLEEGQNGVITIENPDGTKNEIDVSINETDIQKTADDIFNILFALGTVLTVIVGGILGIQFMMASAEDKAKIKEAMIPYVIGSVIIFGAFGIWKLVVTILNEIA